MWIIVFFRINFCKNLKYNSWNKTIGLLNKIRNSHDSQMIQLLFQIFIIQISNHDLSYFLQIYGLIAFKKNGPNIFDHSDFWAH